MPNDPYEKLIDLLTKQQEMYVATSKELSKTVHELALEVKTLAGASESIIKDVSRRFDIVADDLKSAKKSIDDLEATFEPKIDDLEKSANQAQGALKLAHIIGGAISAIALTVFTWAFAEFGQVKTEQQSLKERVIILEQQAGQPKVTNGIQSK